MKKFFSILSGVCIISFVSFNVANANTESVTEEELNTFIKESNVPNGELLSNDQKSALHNSLLEGEAIDFDRS